VTAGLGNCHRVRAVRDIMPQHYALFAVGFWSNIDGRGWKTGGCGAERGVRRVAHGQFERASIGNVRVSKPNPIDSHSIQADALYILVVMGSVMSDEDEVLAIPEMDGDFFKDRTADVVGRNSRSYRVETHH